MVTSAPDDDGPVVSAQQQPENTQDPASGSTASLTSDIPIPAPPSLVTPETVAQPAPPDTSTPAQSAPESVATSPADNAASTTTATDTSSSPADKADQQPAKVKNVAEPEIKGALTFDIVDAESPAAVAAAAPQAPKFNTSPKSKQQQGQPAPTKAAVEEAAKVTALQDTPAPMNILDEWVVPPSLDACCTSCPGACMDPHMCSGADSLTKAEDDPDGCCISSCCGECSHVGHPEWAEAPDYDMICTPRCTIDCFQEKGLGYRGNVSKTKSGKTCLPWTDTQRAEEANETRTTMERNYCRNWKRALADMSREEPWCYTDLTVSPATWEYCDIPTCDPIMWDLSVYKEEVIFDSPYPAGSQRNKDVGVRWKEHQDISCSSVEDGHIDRHLQNIGVTGNPLVRLRQCKQECLEKEACNCFVLVNWDGNEADGRCSLQHNCHVEKCDNFVATTDADRPLKFYVTAVMTEESVADDRYPFPEADYGDKVAPIPYAAIAPGYSSAADPQA